MLSRLGCGRVIPPGLGGFRTRGFWKARNPEFERFGVGGMFFVGLLVMEKKTLEVWHFSRRGANEPRAIHPD